ncbi:MAG: 6,7-dimethyl-8-ribityllumazine synthase [Candidatus Peribacteraceae bacterium]
MPLGDAPDFGSLTLDPKWTIAIVRSEWHPKLTTAVSENAATELARLGIPSDNIGLFTIPGSFELPLACQKALERFDAVIAFGIIVEGQTHHARLIADQAAAGCMQVQLLTGKPVTFEVLYVRNIADAETRVHGVMNTGVIAARTVLSSLARLKEIQ